MLRRLVVLLPVALGCRGVLGIDSLPPLSDGGGGDDAGADVDAAVQTYCDSVSPPARLCSDFDRGEIGTGWENGSQNPDPGESGGGKLALDEALFRSAPASLAMTTPALATSSDRAGAILLLLLVRPVRWVAVSFDVYVSHEDYAAGGFTTIATIDFGNGGALIVRDQLGVSFSTGPDSATFRLTKSVPAGQWRNVTIFIDNEPSDGGPDGFVRIAVDNETAGSATFPAKFQSAGPPKVIVGASASGPSGPFKMNVDDVLVHYEER